MSGTFNISRELWADEAFADDKFSEREAWIWMIAEASWKRRKKRVGDYVVTVERGQMANSVRFMAKAWKWTPAKVQRFLERLKKLEMITSKTDTGVSVITICKYEKYQAKPKAADTVPIQSRYTSDTNEKKGEIREEGISGGGEAREVAENPDPPPPADPPPDPKPEGYRERLLRAVGVDPVSGLTGHGGARLGTQADMLEARRWIDDLGLTEPQVLTAIDEVMARKRDGPPSSLSFFTKPMQRLAAALDAPPLAPADPPNLKAIPGGRRHADPRFDEALRETTRKIRAGEINFRTDEGDPFGSG